MGQTAVQQQIEFVDLYAPGIVTTLVTLTKESAEYYLSFNIEPEQGRRGTNRKSSDSRVNALALVMANGGWKITHQGIALSAPDPTTKLIKLLDGAHRLKAFLKAVAINPDLVIQMNVTTGVDPEAVHGMDIGGRRQFHEFLMMEGQTNTRALSAVARMVWLHHNVEWSMERWKKTPFAIEDMIRFIDAEPLIRESLLARQLVVGVYNTDAACVIWALIAQKWGADTATDFVRRLGSGTNMDKSVPPFALRDYILTNRKKMKWHRFELIALGIKAFNAWQSGSRYTNYFRLDENYPRVIDPTPELLEGMERRRQEAEGFWEE